MVLRRGAAYVDSLWHRERLRGHPTGQGSLSCEPGQAPTGGARSIYQRAACVGGQCCPLAGALAAQTLALCEAPWILRTALLEALARQRGFADRYG
jgi:hypothetical protein